MGNNFLVAQNVCTTHKILSGFTDAFKAVKNFHRKQIWGTEDVGGDCDDFRRFSTIK